MCIRDSRKHRVARAIVRQAQHGRTGRQHRADLGLHRGDDAGCVGLQRGIASLIALHTLLRQRLIQLGLLGPEGGFAPLQFECADETLGAQFLVCLLYTSRCV